MDGNIINSNGESFLYERAKQHLERSTGFEIHPAVSLIELIERNKREIFSKEEWDFVMGPSRVDLVLTKGYGKRRVTLAFESDSGLHDKPIQQKRDQLKNQVLKKSAIPLMRFRPEIHYQANQFNELFIDAVLLSIARREFVKAAGIDSWTDARNSNADHPVFLVLPYQQEFENLVEVAEETALKNNEALEMFEEWNWKDDNTEISYDRQILLGNKKTKTASTGKCSEYEFIYGAYAISERCAKMGCLYKYLVNQNVIYAQRRLFLNFVDDRKNRVPEELLNPPSW
jgi:hypothetical protein